MTTEATDDRGVSSDEEFLSALSSDAGDPGRFFAYTRALKKAGEKERPRQLLQKLAEAQKDLGLFEARIDTLLEIARAFPNRAASPEEMDAALREAYPGHPVLPALIAHYLKPRVSVIEAVEKIRRWLPFEPGKIFFFSGHGAGRVGDVVPTLETVKIDFGGGKRLSMPPGAAAKNLVPLPEGDFRREKFEAPASLAERSLADPPGALRHLLDSVGRPMTATEIKDAFAGVIPPPKWASFWSSARKHPQVVLSGKGKEAVYHWSESSEAADAAILSEFAAASPARLLELARLHGRRAAVVPQITARLAQAAAALRRENPSLAVEMVLHLEEAGAPAPFSAAEALSGPAGPEVARGIADPSARLRAYRLLESLQGAEWPACAAVLFREEQDARALAALDSSLAAAAPELRERLAEQILRAPRGAPRAFLWLCEKRGELSGTPRPFDHRLLASLVDALRQDEFSAHRARVKALFDRGGLAIELVASLPDEEEARRILHALERAPGLEDFRRDDLKQAILRRFEGLRGPRAEPLYATAEALTARRQELEHLVKVEIPANGRAVQEAAAMGDLRENFEYHAARSRAELLSARAAKLRDEIARARVLDPTRVDASQVRVGTRLRLARKDGERVITILGPWESRPEDDVYSYQSDFASRLLGLEAGATVEFSGSTWTIAEIRPWR